jgi:hypothetical protein
MRIKGKAREVVQLGVRRTIGVVLLIAGILCLVVGVAADPLGMGGSVGIGDRQIEGIGAGVIVISIGAVLMRRTL